MVFGDYPDVMKKNAGSRIPAFTLQESKSIRGSFDFLGLNYYYEMFVKDKSSTLLSENRDLAADMGIQLLCMPLLLEHLYTHQNILGFLTWKSEILRPNPAMSPNLLKTVFNDIKAKSFCTASNNIKHLISTSFQLNWLMELHFFFLLCGRYSKWPIKIWGKNIYIFNFFLLFYVWEFCIVLLIL